MLGKRWIVCLMAGTAVSVVSGCGGARGTSSHGEKTVIRVEGSDTMVNVAQAWAERYHEEYPGVSVQVLGGGSGVGIASLTDGNCDMADASRQMKEKEIQRLRQKRGVEPIQHIVGYDALAVYVHKDNPLESISIEELAEIYGENGKITDWSQVDPADGKPASGEIVRISRQNNSGTYYYFREAVLGKRRDYKLGSIDQSGSKDVVALVSRTPGGIGYSGMGYATPEVKMLKISTEKNEPGVAPTVENAKDGSYPITRPLYIYTAGKLGPAGQKYLDWILSPAGQTVLRELGYVPVGEHE